MSKIDLRLIDEEEILEEILPQPFVKIPKKKKFDDGTKPRRKDTKRTKKTKRIIKKELSDEE
jgi:hypothetical protein